MHPIGVIVSSFLVGLGYVGVGVMIVEEFGSGERWVKNPYKYTIEKSDTTLLGLLMLLILSTPMFVITCFSKLVIWLWKLLFTKGSYKNINVKFLRKEKK